MAVSFGPEPRNDKEYSPSYDVGMPSESNELAPPEQFDCTCEELEKLRADITRLTADVTRLTEERDRYRAATDADSIYRETERKERQQLGEALKALAAFKEACD